MDNVSLPIWIHIHRIRHTRKRDEEEFDISTNATGSATEEGAKHDHRSLVESMAQLIQELRPTWEFEAMQESGFSESGLLDTRISRFRGRDKTVAHIDDENSWIEVGSIQTTMLELSKPAMIHALKESMTPDQRKAADEAVNRIKGLQLVGPDGKFLH